MAEQTCKHKFQLTCKSKIFGIKSCEMRLETGELLTYMPIPDGVRFCFGTIQRFYESEDGQKIISDNGYIEVENTGSFTSSKVKGSIVVAGSSSVTPVMEKLKEAYAKVNSNASIEIQESDSTTGVNSAIEGTCDIGMASRDLKDEEKGVKATAIAKDGIAVIVNNNNTIDDLTVDQIKDIFTGAVTTWADVK